MVESECQCIEFGSQVTTGPGVTQWLLTPQCQYILSSVNWGWLERGSVTETGARLIYKCEEPPPESNIKTQGTFVINDDFLIINNNSLFWSFKIYFIENSLDWSQWNYYLTMVVSSNSNLINIFNGWTNLNSLRLMWGWRNEYEMDLH